MDRFWAKVKKTDLCWIWRACHTRGYGRFGFRGKLAAAHRVSYILTYGEVPDGMFVLHKCDNPSCVRPDHLFVGTHLDNMRDKASKGRQLRGERHNFTPFTAEDIERIRDVARNGAKHAHIAKYFGVTHQAIRSIINRKSWRHV